MEIKKYASAISFLIIIAAIYLSFSSLMPKKASDNSTPLTEFSTERALVHLHEITKKPHYVGTDEHKIVRDYIIKQLQELGLEVTVQNQVAVHRKWRAGANTQNILARIPGSNNTKALLLLSHYDSAPHASFGASDAGSGVVTLLEGIRVFLATKKQAKNDIIFLITDAEELGLLGANAFVNFHPWTKDVGLVLNFEARGSGGPSYMILETNGGNKNLIQQFKKANPKYPVASSLMYSIYKMLPNDTDLTVFREDGDIDGINFAFIDDFFDYHTAQDTYRRLDRNTLEHNGTYLMPLLHHFANIDLAHLKSEEDYVYTNIPFLGMVYYPYAWVYPMLILSILLFIGFVSYGFMHQKLNFKEIAIGFIPLLLSLVVSGLLAVYGWKLIKQIHPQYDAILQGFPYNGHLYTIGFSALTMAIFFFIYRKYDSKIKLLNLSIAPVFLWILINIAIATFLKGAGYFIISVFYGIAVLGILVFSKNTKSKTILFSILFIPILFVFPPLIQMFPVGLGLKMLVISTTLVGLLFGLLIPVFSTYTNKKHLQKLFFIFAFLSFSLAAFTSGYSIDRKKPNSLIYVIDTDKNEAYWASYDKKIDTYTQQALGENPTKGSYDNKTSASKYRTGIQLHKKTEVKKIPQPNIQIQYDTIIGNYRNISLSILPNRSVNRIELTANNNITFHTFIVNKTKMPLKAGANFVFKTNKKSNKHILSYYISSSKEYLELNFSIPKDQKPSITLKEISFDLLENPLFNIRPREEFMMPTPFVINDAIIIKKQITF